MKSLDQTPVEPGAAACPALPGAPRLAATGAANLGARHTTGWLRDQLDKAAAEMATWPEWKRVAAAEWARNTSAARREDAAGEVPAASAGGAGRAGAYSPDSATGAGS